jgi:hypothetical protein
MLHLADGKLVDDLSNVGVGGTPSEPVQVPVPGEQTQ